MAAAALHGLLLAGRDGRGAHLDVSLQEAIAALNQSQFNALERTGAVRWQASASNPTISLLPASDGWVAISPREEHQWARWLTVMGNPAWGQEPRFATRRSRAEHWSALHALLAEWSGQRPRLEIFEAAQAARVACYPLGVPTDLFASPQLAAREFFQEAPGRPAIPAAGPAKPLAGVRIVDFSWVLTGPICTKFLAPDDLDDVRTGAPEERLQLLNDLAVAADGTAEALEVAVDDEHQVAESLRPGREMEPRLSGSSHSSFAGSGWRHPP